MITRPTVVDLFCGAGGLSEGFRQAGYNVLVGQDWDKTAGRTFLSSHPNARFLGGSIQDVTCNDILEAADLEKGSLDVLVGGPPCQGFSINNHKRGEDDPRTSLFRDYLRVVEGLQPKWVVMENVTGMLSLEKGKFIREVIHNLEQLNYCVNVQVLKAEEYGIPQERRRIVFIGNRMGIPISFPATTHGNGKQKFVSIWDAISDLPRLENGQTSSTEPYRCEPKNSFQLALRGRAERPQNHLAPNLSPLNLERLSHIPPGGSWRDIPIGLLPEGMKRAKRSDHTKRYGRPRKSDLSCTILTKCDIHWGAYIHPTQDRAFSVREAARLQSFPDSFVFQGSMTEQFVQIGNAVPPVMARCIANHLLDLGLADKGKSRTKQIHLGLEREEAA